MIIQSKSSGIAPLLCTYSSIKHPATGAVQPLQLFKAKQQYQ